MKILDLVLKHQWYDMIDSGEKKEEYREIKPFWDNKFSCQSHGLCDLYKNCKQITLGIGKCEKYTHVKFHRGYTNTTMTFELESIKVGIGNPQWGAPDNEVFIIKLGKRL